MEKIMETIKAWLKKRSVAIFLAQIGIYLMVCATWCVVLYFTEHDPMVAIATARTNAVMFFLLLIVFMANFYVLVPYLYEDKSKLRRWLFWVVEFILIFLLNHDLFWPHGIEKLETTMHLHYYQFSIIWLVLNYVVAIAAISVRYFIHQSDLRKQLLEEKQRNAEAELAWLKNQLNPHFLFNTLNNISSLTQIDADEAQNSIGELSDLLRYALYETQQKEVLLCGEIAFMENYISLMALRCDKNVKITTHFDAPDTARTIAPMLFLSPIENAFKHGVSTGKPSFIDISLTEENGVLVFSCQNSNHPKDSCDRSGSGIGIENMRKRLELMYAKRYEMSQTVERGVYKLQIKIRTRS